MDNTLTIEAVTSNLDQVLDFINARLEEWGCPIKTQTRIDIAVEEIFVNIANYAYGDNVGEATIVVSQDEEKSQVSITFKDSGVEYNPLAKEDPDLSLPASERPIGGLGIYMVKEIADDVSYEYKDGMNIFTLSKGI